MLETVRACDTCDKGSLILIRRDRPKIVMNLLLDNKGFLPVVVVFRESGLLEVDECHHDQVLVAHPVAAILIDEEVFKK